MPLQLKRKIILIFILFLSFLLIPLISVHSENFHLLTVFNFKKNNKQEIDEKKSDTFCVLDESSGKILKIPERELIYATVACEMPALFETEALKAQAVASYTHFCKLRNDASKTKQGYDFKVDTQNGINFIFKEQMQQKWGNDYEKYYSKIKNAVDTVYGEIIEFDGKPIFAAYHAISSGKTENSRDVFSEDLKYLTSVESPGDKTVNGYTTKVDITSEKFKTIISSNCSDYIFDNPPKNWIGDSTRTEGGSVKEIELCGHTFKGKDVRNMFNLRSNNFHLEYNAKDNKFTFTVFGYGHGVGMSQCGAQDMAKKGANYKNILAWYYPYTEITVVI